VTKDYVGDKFFIRKPGLFATPLFVVLLVVETTDVLFAVDSIPAVLAITRDAFIVYTSNVFAIMGLRSMYFALAGLIEMFRYLHYGLAVVLMFVGVKMIGSNYLHLPTWVALGVVVVVLGVAVASLHPESQKTNNLARAPRAPWLKGLAVGVSQKDANSRRRETNAAASPREPRAPRG
jgi:tellurite resistance protein TerC